MAVPFIREAAVAQILTVEDSIAVVERALCDQAVGKAENLPRQRLKVGSASLHMLAASWEGEGVYGQKIYSVGPEGSQFWVLLYHADGRPYAILEAQRLGQIRTGAASGIATRALARKDSRRVGVIGSGYQMRTQLEAVCSVRPIEAVKAWSPNAERLQTFCDEMSESLHLPVSAATSAAEAVIDADVIVTLTTAASPVLRGGEVREGVHLNIAGSNRPDRREVDATLFRRANCVVTDDIAQARTESGDLISAIDEGALTWESVRRLSDVVADPDAGRLTATDITLFKSHGIGLWDIAAASFVAERAIEQGLASQIEIDSGPDVLAPKRFRGRGS